MMKLKNKSECEFVAEDFRTAVVFQKHGIDFCCKGSKSIDEVCENNKLSAVTLLGELSIVSGPSGNCIMKKIFLTSLVVAFLFSCSNNKQSQDKMSYGAPQASVSTVANVDTAIKGPLSYGAEVPKIMDGDTVEVKFDVIHRLVSISPTISFIAWTFGGTVPGPVLHVRQGQTIKFSMTDRSNETMPAMDMHINSMPMPHSIDFHAAMVNPEDKYRTIQPGETIHFQWTANYPGVFMYHCGTPMVLLHMIYGMLGVVIVEPKDGYPDKVEHEYAIVQTEFYLKKQGDIYVPDTALAMKRQPTAVAFNGRIGQYLVHPLKAKAGERIRFYVMNDGPNNATNFHVIGTILDKVYLDGNPFNELHGMQSVYLGPASGAVLEFVLPEKGRYTFVDHSFADAELGAKGEIDAE
jgi:nitrite reductase (NO-forming)